LFRLLGPTELVVAGRAVGLGSTKQRTVLAALLVDAGRPVSPATLVDRVWDDPSAVNPQRVLHTYVSRLRRVLERAAAAEPPGADAAVELVRRPAGYVLEVQPDRVDLHRFTRIVVAAGGLGSDTERAVVLRQALGLWRGTPLADLPGQWAARVRDDYVQHHLDARAAVTFADRAPG
jgi:DNA-binding SARP family transcriptional activator